MIKFWRMVSILAFVSLFALNIGNALASDDDWITSTSSGNTYLTSGNVGIGTASPTAKLTVKGTAYTDLGWGGDTGLFLDGSGDTSGQNWVNIRFNGTTSDGIIRLAESNQNRGFQFGVNDAKNEDMLMALSINGNGNVGIGTPSPTTKLTVKGTAYTDLGWAGDTGLFLDGSGDVSEKNWVNIRFNGTTSDGIIRLAESNQNRGFQFGVNNAKNEDMQLALSINGNGNVGIGTPSPGVGIKLDVVGKVRAHEIIVNLDNPADFVFEEDYNLPTLNQVESFIKENKHLPDIPSAKEVKENGIGVSEMIAKQMQKIEELTLYVIEQNKEIQGLKKKLAELEERQ